jgi:ribosomal protein S27AE
MNGETIKARYEGPGKPDLTRVRPLLGVMKAHKPDVVYFLRSFCARCGGCCFVPDYEGRSLCLACDWAALEKLYPAMAGGKH